MSDKKIEEMKSKVSKKKIVAMILVGIIVGTAVGIGASIAVEYETSLEQEQREAKEIWNDAKEREKGRGIKF